MDDEKITKKVRSDRFNNFIFSIIAVVCIVIIAVAVSPKTLQNDTFYNIKCGEYILQNGISNLTEDPFSWHNLPYTWPHWLYDLGIYILYHIFGSHWEFGFYIVTIILTSILGISLYKTSTLVSKGNRVVSAIATLFAVYLMKP